MSDDIKYLVADPPNFKGYCEDILIPPETKMMYSWITPEQYIEKHGYPCRLLSQQELEQVIRDYEESMITQPQLVEEDEFWLAMEELPPHRDEVHHGIRFFHVSEPYYGSIVRWYADDGDFFFSFLDLAKAGWPHLVRKVKFASL